MTYIIVALLLVVALCGYWRYRCRHKSIPWPHQLAFFLENPFMHVFCNKHDLAEGLVQLVVQDTPPADEPVQVLDLGCGAGRILIPFAKLCELPVQLTAMDMQPEMLAKARAAAAEDGLKGICFRELTLHPPYTEPLGSYHLIYCVTVIGEIPSLADVFNLLYGSLILGGKLSITETLPDPCYVPAAKVRAAAEAAGLTWLATRHGMMTYTIEFVRIR